MAYKFQIVETSLKLDGEQRAYFLEMARLYLKLYLRAWHIIEGEEYLSRDDKADYLKDRLIKEFNVSWQLARSVVADAENNHKVLLASKKKLKTSFECRVRRTEKEIEDLKCVINEFKKNINHETPKRIKEYKKKKEKLYWTQIRLCTEKSTLESVKKQISTNKLHAAIGGKEIFKRQYNLKAYGYNSHEEWYLDYRSKIENKFYYVGDKVLFKGNSNVILDYNPETDKFRLKLNKETSLIGDGSSFLLFTNITFKYMKDELVRLIKRRDMNRGGIKLSFRFLKRDERWYIQTMIMRKFDKYISNPKNGMIGLDFNDGFISLCEVDSHGNPTKFERIDLLEAGDTNKARTELEQKISKVLKRCATLKVPLSIESLNFDRTKSNSTKFTGNRNYNRMIHSLYYSRYIDICSNIAFNNKVELFKVDPSYTSQNGRERYCKKLNITVHEAASLVVARRALGLSD